MEITHTLVNNYITCNTIYIEIGKADAQIFKLVLSMKLCFFVIPAKTVITSFCGCII